MNLDNYDELQNSKNSIDSFEEKMGNLNLILSGVAFSTLSIPILSNLNLTKVEEAIGVGASMLVVTPLWYCGFKKLAAKSNKKLDKDMHHMNQLMLMLMETREKDRRIGELTASFFEEICDAENQNGIRLSFDNKNNLNQFIYMINSNYYDRIALNLPSITRELLVEKIINLAFLYLKETGKNDFTHKDVSKILEGCYYIKDDLKKEIIKEFRKSRAKIGDKYIYQIVRNDMDIDKNDNVYLDKKKGNRKES